MLFGQHQQGHESDFKSYIELIVSVLMQSFDFSFIELVFGYIHDHLPFLRIFDFIMDVAEIKPFVQRADCT